VNLDDEQRNILAFIARGGFDDVAQICEQLMRRAHSNETVTLDLE
jgi:hypothetical protein